MSEALPPRVNFEHLKKQAKSLVRKHREKDRKSKLADAQRMIARRHGFATWAKLKAQVSAADKADPLKLAKDAFAADDAKTLADLIEMYPQLKEAVNQPIGA